MTIAHGLGVAPELIQIYLECQTAELGYSINDFVPVNNHRTQDGTASQGVSVVLDSTNLNLRFGSTAAAFSLLNKSTGTSANITNGNWELIIRAWA